MIPQNKKVKDLMDFTFPPEQQIPMAPESEIPQMEGLVPQQTQPIEDYSEMLDQDQIDKTLSQSSVPTEDPRIAQYQELLKKMSSKIGTPRSSGATTSIAQSQPDFRDRMAEELKQAREENRQDLLDARSADSKTQLGNNLMKSFSQIGEGFANRSGRTDIKMPAQQFAAEQAQAMATNNKEKLAGLMEQYQLMSDKEKAKIDAENRKIAAEDKASDRNYKQQMLELEKLKMKGSGEDSKIEKEVMKENRKERRQLDADIPKTESLLADLKKAKSMLDAYGKTGIRTGTGPIATLGGLTGYIGEDANALKAQFNKISLDSMTKMFQGMSKAVDSEGERRMFEGTQPSLGNDDITNNMLLDDRIKAVENMLNKQRKTISNFDRYGKFTNQESSDQSQPTQSDTKTINGKTYKKVSGGWQEI